MRFNYYDLNYLDGGEIIEVTLSASANVCLLDSYNFHNYKNGQSFDCWGGHVKISPYELVIPYAGHWYVTIDLGGKSGSVTHSCRVIRPQSNEYNTNKHSPTNIEKLKWQIQDENPDCTVKVTSRWLEKHPNYGDPNIERTDFLVFDKKSGNLHKHFSIGEDTNWELHEWHDWY